MANRILNYALVLAAEAVMEGEFNIGAIEINDSDDSNVAVIVIDSQDVEQKEVRIVLFKREGGAAIHVYSEEGRKFAEKIRDGMLSRPEVSSCIINER